MKKSKPIFRNAIKSVETYEGETIEQKVARITQNKEPIKDGAPLIYNERKDGVQPAYNVRTDRWDIAIEAMNKVTMANIAKREGKFETPIKPNENTNNNENQVSPGDA
ncbi:hypothetical protein [Peromfec virus RodF8_19]|uniref:Uncharacterized protein n=1 Tax=Peromfec virus RodF8_19 TaxID=2929361 RepID=A0A976N2B4_9VIRU|nr:hypothetical protein [Peromfec virus RodF8_19]